MNHLQDVSMVGWNVLEHRPNKIVQGTVDSGCFNPDGSLFIRWIQEEGGITRETMFLTESWHLETSPDQNGVSALRAANDPNQANMPHDEASEYHILPPGDDDES